MHKRIPESMYLGIEIGGTKLQLGVGTGDRAELAAWERHDVAPERGAAGILDQIERTAAELLRKYDITRVAFGFGGPVDAAAGRVTKSHQISGWEGLPLAEWSQKTLGLPAILCNDCDAATLAEARFGAGRGKRTVFFVTVGTGIGGGFAIDGQLHGAGRPAVAEIGHLRPGLHADRAESTVESLASGWGIVAAARSRIVDHVSWPLEAVRSTSGRINREIIRQRLEDAERAGEEFANDLLGRCRGEVDRLTGAIVAQAAEEGNEIAREVLEHAIQTLGWAVAQMITLLAPEIVVVGGGVSLIGPTRFFVPLRRAVARYVFPPLQGSYEIVPAALGELVVVHGAVAIAANPQAGSCPPGNTPVRDANPTCKP